MCGQGRRGSSLRVPAGVPLRDQAGASAPRVVALPMACPQDEALPWAGADLERFAATWRLGSLLATVYRVDHVSHGESMAPVVGLELSLEKVAPGPGKLLRAQGSEPVHSATPGSAGDGPCFTCLVVPASTFWRPRPLSPCLRAPRF